MSVTLVRLHVSTLHVGVHVNIREYRCRLMVKLTVLSDPMNPEDNLFSFRRSVVEAGELRHSMSLIVKKDVCGACLG